MRRREYRIRNGKKSRIYRGKEMLKAKRNFRLHKTYTGGSRLKRRAR